MNNLLPKDTSPIAVIADITSKSPSTYVFFNNASPPTKSRLFNETSSSTFNLPLIEASDAILLIENGVPPT